MTAEIDVEKLKAYAKLVFGALGGAMTATMIHLGDRLGLYRALADGEALTSAELAARTGCAERLGPGVALPAGCGARARVSGRRPLRPLARGAGGPGRRVVAGVRRRLLRASPGDDGHRRALARGVSQRDRAPL